MAEVKNVKEQEVIKFTEEEVSSIKKFREDFSQITARLGEIEIEGIILKSQQDKLSEMKSEVESNYKQLRADEIKLAGELKEKYGDGEFDLETGIFTPVK
jgi:esterase/lipase